MAKVKYWIPRNGRNKACRQSTRLVIGSGADAEIFILGPHSYIELPEADSASSDPAARYASRMVRTSTLAVVPDELPEENPLPKKPVKLKKAEEVENLSLIHI